MRRWIYHRPVKGAGLRQSFNVSENGYRPSTRTTLRRRSSLPAARQRSPFALQTSPKSRPQPYCHRSRVSLTAVRPGARRSPCQTSPFIRQYTRGITGDNRNAAHVVPFNSAREFTALFRAFCLQTEQNRQREANLTDSSEPVFVGVPVSISVGK